MVYAALVVAGLALAVSILAAVRGPGEAASSAVCVDQDARAQIVALRRALAERDALVGRLARAAAVPAEPPSAAAEARPAGVPAPAGRPRYTHFETPNPAVSVTQNPDGTYEIRTTDPALAGSVMEVTAVGPSGETDKMFIRIPQ